MISVTQSSGFGGGEFYSGERRAKRHRSKDDVVINDMFASDDSDTDSEGGPIKKKGALLEKMGYKGGGLGKNAQGIVAPIQAKLRPKNMGMGFNHYKEAANVPTLQESVDEIKVPGIQQKEKPWLKKEYATAEEFFVKKQEQGLDVVQKVFDMRGPQFRLKNERETFVILHNEKEKLKDNAALEKKQLDTIEEMVSVMERLSLLGTLTLESLATSFVDLHTRFPNEYKIFSLATIASSFALPLFIREFQGWDPLQNPTHGLNVMSLWKDLLEEDEIFDSLFMEVVFPAVVRLSGTNTWQARDPEPLLRFLDSWEQLLPHSVLQTILDNIVMPKLASTVDSWDPRRETIPIHLWVHPWLPLLGPKLETLYHTILNRLESVLHAWHPSDMSAYYILSPWKTVFDPIRWEQIMVRYILPKLLVVMHEFEVNPVDQKLDQFYWVRTWASVIPIHHMLHIMDVFFNKWQEVLYQWLCSKPDFQEVRKWYLSWKDLIPSELLSNEHVRYRLNMGLNMMNQAAEGLEVIQPGLRGFEAQKAAAQVEKGCATEEMGGGGGGVDMSLKEVIEVHAQQNNLMFKPKVGRMKDGHQVYGFGKVSMIIDSLNQKVYAQIEDKWSLVTLEQLVKLEKSSVLRRHALSFKDFGFWS
ncbi:unnamed protein product [Lactuca virosa]|uniref:G-patch domain-containing protein n=1 Tax=Lactuca virosa TaxID=75947 RepID=A0AAU9P6U4_9ASTR|nr:unnamed protein product [Lactuca virosa]